MNHVSLRTKGLIFIVVISFIPLILAGAGNYFSVKEAMIQSEIDKTLSKQSKRASELASWMAIRKAEVLVMSRTEVVRYGTDEERLQYFEGELLRSSYTYDSIGYVDVEGIGVSTIGQITNMAREPFFEEAIRGNVIITDPYTPYFAKSPQTLLVVPVYGASYEVKGVVYTSILLSSLNPYMQLIEGQKTLQLFNQTGNILYNSDESILSYTNLFDEQSMLAPVASQLVENYEGMVSVNQDGVEYAVFYSKVNGTPWGFVLLEQAVQLEKTLKPIFVRIATLIASAEVVIVIFFFLYFKRIIKRLEPILAVTEQAADGRFKAEHLAVEPFDEIGQLAHSVNGMMEHLQKMFDRLEAIINQNQYGFIVLNEHYKVSYMNQTAEEMIGYSLEELAGHATPLLFMAMDEIEEEALLLSERLGREVQPGLDVFVAQREESFSYEREWTFIHKNGTRIPMLHSSNGLRDRNGKFSGVVGMIQDISDRKHMEKARNQLLDILGSAKDLIASVDSTGKIIYINQAGRDMLGLPGPKEDEGMVERYVQPHMYAELTKGASMAKEHGFWESSVQLLKENGQLLHVSIVVVAHPDESTGELFFSCIARDISEQKMVQEELVRATLEAEEANQAKSRFLALMSHEIRTPLNGIIGLSQLLSKTGLSVSQKDYMDKMNTCSETLLRLINDMLDFSKIEAGKIEVERLPFQPNELLHRITDQLSVWMGGKEQFEFIIDTPTNLPQTILGDSMRLEQVMLNLCMNAIKFTNKGRVKLQITVTEQTAEYAKLRFSILDTGIGMNVAQLEKLFQPFTQADGSTTRKFGGTGLGLVIAKSMVDLMGGRLEVVSEAGAGSEFYFTISFPIIEQHSEPKQRVHPDKMDDLVWIVEDDDSMREHLAAIVDSYGLTSLTFDSWKRASERLRRIGAGVRPKLILLDMEMPDMYGKGTWLAFHKEAEAVGIKTIAITTSYGRDEMLQLPVVQRPLMLLIKPFTRTTMLQAIDSALAYQSEVDNGQEATTPTAAVWNGSTNIRILLAEDNNINQLVATEMLKEQGYEVGLAENGQIVLDKLAQQKWDLILMDIHMPVMDGADAVRIIRSQPQYDSIPIIAVTANMLRDDHERYLKLGMNDVVTKPVSADRLHAVISYWLKKSIENSDNRLTSEQNKLEATKSALVQVEQIRKLPEIDGMDMESALARVNGKLPILMHMMAQFKLDYETFVVSLRWAMEQNQPETVRRMIHTLKAAAGYLSALTLMEAASEVERIVKHSDPDEEELEASIIQLELNLKQLLDGLKRVEEAFDNKP